MRTLSLALALALVAGCGGPTWRHGARLVNDGRFYDATWYWIRALDADEYDQGALRGLEHWATEGFRQRLDIAREHEAEGRYAESLAAYDDLFALEAELVRVAAIDFTPRPELRHEREDVEDALALDHLAQARAAVEAERYEDAIGRFERALALRPQLPDAGRELADAWYRWGRLTIEQERYPEAAERLERAWELGAGEEAKAWAAAVHRALGRHWLRAGACRAAVTELRAGADGPPDPDLALDLAAAQDCARTELVVQPFEAVAGDEVRGTAPGAMVSDELEARLRADGSDFLTLLDPRSDAAEAAVRGESGLSRPGRLYEVRGRITQLTSERPEPTVTERTVTGTRKVLCPVPEGVYYAPETWCDEDVTVVYQERSESVSARAAGSVRIVDPRSSEQILTRPIQADLSREIVHARDFQGVRGEERFEVQVGAVATGDVVALPEDILALRERPGPLPTDSALAAEVTAALARHAADAVLATVDVDRDAPAPTSLAIEAPVTSADQLRLEAGDAQREADAPTEGGTRAPSRVVIPR